jgi:hypothetical protein
MATEYIGSIVMEVNGQEVEVASLDATRRTNHKLVKTMNRDGRARGYASGIEEIELSAEVVIPRTGDLDWTALGNFKVTCYPWDGSKQPRKSYLDCRITEVGDRFDVENEARRTLGMMALREVTE